MHAQFVFLHSLPMLKIGVGQQNNAFYENEHLD